MMEERRMAEQEKIRNETRLEELANQERRNEELRRKQQQREEPVTKMRRIVLVDEAQGGRTNYIVTQAKKLFQLVENMMQQYHFNFLKTPHKFIIAMLSIRKLGFSCLRIETFAMINLCGVCTKVN